MSEPPLLLLWDIDGTLLQQASLEHAQAIHAALGEIHGVEELHRHAVEAAGRTDGAIARDLLLASGVEPHAIDAAIDQVAAAAIAAYERLCPPDLSGKLTPGITDALAALAAEPERYRLSLVTGNMQAIARRKLDAAGIGHFFELDQGGFGSDAEDRSELPRIARERAGGWPRERTVVIGDTPRDIACARADGVHVVAVTTGPYDAHALADADAICDSPAAVLPVLADLAG